MKWKGAGRKVKYDNVEELQKLIDEYFEECATDNERPTVTGLAYYLDMDRKRLLEYENCIDDDEKLKTLDKATKQGFRNTIKRAKRYIEKGYEECLTNSKGSPIGAIFTLKNNYKWVDKTEQVVENKSIDVELKD